MRFVLIFLLVMGSYLLLALGELTWSYQSTVLENNSTQNIVSQNIKEPIFIGFEEKAKIFNITLFKYGTHCYKNAFEFLLGVSLISLVLLTPISLTILIIVYVFLKIFPKQLKFTNNGVIIYLITLAISLFIYEQYFAHWEGLVFNRCI